MGKIDGGRALCLTHNNYIQYAILTRTLLHMKIYPWGPFYWRDSILIPASKHNHTQYKVWDVVSSNILGMWLLTHDGIEVNR